MPKEAEPLLSGTAENGERVAAKPQRKVLGVLCAAAVSVGAIGGVVLTHGLITPWGGETLASSTLVPPAGLRLSNKYTRKLGRSIGNGRYTAHENLAEAHKPTRLELNDGVAALWRVDGLYASIERESSIEVVFPHGLHTVTAKLADGTTTEFTVTSRWVRRELRDLDTSDRESYFDAVRTVYFTDQEKGEKLYGSDYKSAAWLVREHLYGAAERECDHWHDDAGFMNHHIGVTWQFEQSIQSVDPTTAAHYWDYTIDADSDYEWWKSPIFDDDWFGSAWTNGDDHVVKTGRFAFTPVMTDAWEWSNITNPYGLLRSPWNTNPTPYLMRSPYILDHLGDGYKKLPACKEFQEQMLSATNLGGLGALNAAINGGLHGPVHLMVGGMWHFDQEKWEAVTSRTNYSDSFLLLSKSLWRQGYIRCPEYCGADIPASECTCSCPTEILNGRSAAEILNVTGMNELNSNIYKPTLETLMNEYGLSHDDYLEMLCHVGQPGEMFTSAAPQDPVFWPLHGNAERFLQFARAMKAAGYYSFSEQWTYTHHTHLPSDTGLVCDWTGIDPYNDMALPSCTKETCPGHKSDDLLPFSGLMSTQEGLYTNLEFYNLTSPFNTNLPYVYDSMDVWTGCKDGTIIAWEPIDNTVPDIA